MNLYAALLCSKSSCKLGISIEMPPSFEYFISDAVVFCFFDGSFRIMFRQSCSILVLTDNFIVIGKLRGKYNLLYYINKVNY